MNILGLDFGTRRIGLAIKRDGVNLVLPFGVFEWNGEDEKIAELVDLIIKEQIGQVVVGLPLSLEGEETPNTKRVRKFAEKLAEKGLNIIFADERFSSQEADTMGGVASRDEKSAMVILDEYLSK